MKNKSKIEIILLMGKESIQLHNLFNLIILFNFIYEIFLSTPHSYHIFNLNINFQDIIKSLLMITYFKNVSEF